MYTTLYRRHLSHIIIILDAAKRQPPHNKTVALLSLSPVTHIYILALNELQCECALASTLKHLFNHIHVLYISSTCIHHLCSFFFYFITLGSLHYRHLFTILQFCNNYNQCKAANKRLYRFLCKGNF